MRYAQMIKQADDLIMKLHTTADAVQYICDLTEHEIITTQRLLADIEDMLKKNV